MEYSREQTHYKNTLRGNRRKKKKMSHYKTLMMYPRFTTHLMYAFEFEGIYYIHQLGHTLLKQNKTKQVTWL